MSLKKGLYIWEKQNKMEMMGLCSICGKPSGMHTCSLCGRNVCKNCFDQRNKVCVECKKEPY